MKNILPVIYKDLRRLLNAKKNSELDTVKDLQQQVQGWFKWSKDWNDRILDKAAGVSRGLAKFSTQTGKDEGDIRRQLKFLDRRGQNYGQGLLIARYVLRHLIKKFQRPVVSLPLWRHSRRIQNAPKRYVITGYSPSALNLSSGKTENVYGECSCVVRSFVG